ncbi:MAG TPA: CoA pyrophosphatase [Candidatus Binataceae bacterium]|jgi:8-oxo-dGTP pyrophosphatase MutT (NUDIX family)
MNAYDALQTERTRGHIERIERELGGNRPASKESLMNQKSAAVLVPLFESEGELHAIFIRRSDHVASHRGQVAFPGGRVDAADRDLLATALREAHEEVNIQPGSVRVLGSMPALSTLTSGITVAPFVGLVGNAAGLRPDPAEVAEIFDVPLTALADPRYRGHYELSKSAKYPAILYDGQTIWGLTLRITDSLLEISGITPPGSF